MSFWSTLGKLGKGALNVATGGVGGGILDAIGGIAGKAAEGSAGQRINEQPGIVQTQNSNLMGQQFNANEQDRGFKRQMLQSLLGGVKDAEIGMPAGSTIPQFTISGGLRPSALDGSREALMASLGQPTMTAPKPLELPEAGMMEKILGGVGLGGSLLGALGQARRPGTQPILPSRQLPVDPLYRGPGL